MSNKYVIWFDFPYGKTYFKCSYLEESTTSNRCIEIPEFTQDILAAMEFDDKDEALRRGKFFAGKYGYGVELV